eukprot:4154431-Prymnesium_polylepis.1
MRACLLVLRPIAPASRRPPLAQLANDLNPASAAALASNARRNGVAPLVAAYNLDAAEFVRRAACSLRGDGALSTVDSTRDDGAAVDVAIADGAAVDATTATDGAADTLAAARLLY